MFTPMVPNRPLNDRLLRFPMMVRPHNQGIPVATTAVGVLQSPSLTRVENPELQRLWRDYLQAAESVGLSRYHMRTLTSLDGHLEPPSATGSYRITVTDTYGHRGDTYYERVTGLADIFNNLPLELVQTGLLRLSPTNTVSDFDQLAVYHNYLSSHQQTLGRYCGIVSYQKDHFYQQGRPPARNGTMLLLDSLSTGVARVIEPDSDPVVATDTRGNHGILTFPTAKISRRLTVGDLISYTYYPMGSYDKPLYVSYRGMVNSA